MANNYLSPLRYPGSKRKLAPEIKKMLQKYGYANANYTLVEPCCGGASVSLYLLDQNVVSSAILIDKDPWVASFWEMLFHHTDQLVNDIKNVDVTVEQWNKLRETPPKTSREEALYCFFFNRTCYSGILNGGMIGGKEQKSKYTIDCRFNKAELIDRINQTAEKFVDKVIKIQKGSVFDILDQEASGNYKDRIYYVDPPYVGKGQRLYPHNFGPPEHEKLRSSLRKLRSPWILSYHDHELIYELYKDEKSLDNIHFDIWWVADGAKKGTEILISNFSSLEGKQPIRSPVQQSLWAPTVNHVTETQINHDLREEQVLHIPGD